MAVQSAQAIESCGLKGQDRVALLPLGDRVIVVVADGAGGTGAAGAVAADVLLRHTRAATASGVLELAAILEGTDRELLRSGSGGQTTAIVASVGSDGIVGASVGDSEAWLISAAGSTELTRNQHRKPLLGSGAAAPVTFAAPNLNGTLVIATDGLWRYVDRRRMLAVVTSDELDLIPARLIDLVRLRSGRLQDDVAIVVCRRDG